MSLVDVAYHQRNVRLEGEKEEKLAHKAIEQVVGKFPMETVNYR